MFLLVAEFIEEAFQDIPMVHGKHRELKRHRFKKKHNHTPHHHRKSVTSDVHEYDFLPSEDNPLDLKNDKMKKEEEVNEPITSFGRGMMIRRGKTNKGKGISPMQQKYQNPIPSPGKSTSPANIEERVKLVIEKIHELKARLANHNGSEINNSEQAPEPGKSGRSVAISKHISRKFFKMGRGIASSVDLSTTPSSGIAVRGAAPQDNTDKEYMQESQSEAPPVRVWGDECVPNFDAEHNQIDDECSIYTRYAFGEKNANKLSCDAEDLICQCLPDENNNRAEFSKELQICLLPRYYTCTTTQECAPLLTCSKATARDYEIDPNIKQGFPKICRLMLNITNEAVITFDNNRLSLVNVILFVLNSLRILP
ncbi:unnamed protein product [Allacma fusca]|uniref:Uncharacterized protein n=1 Tax=Allacma fusca TaxID=39272 RepID=A0A8J2L2C5_9HEXA|nr:unnamed protein product [Allacma fusca]